jgi:hypothetical protein
MTNDGKLFFLTNHHRHFKKRISTLTTALRLRWNFQKALNHVFW